MKLKQLNEFSTSVSNLIRTTKVYDIPAHFNTDTSNGWKLSVLGKSLSDVEFLVDRLSNYLITNKIPFKFATQKRLNHKNKEQARKLMTIYVPNNMNHMVLAEELYKKILDYDGWYNIKTPNSYQHYAGGIFYRNDRDSSGKYIPA